MTDFHYALGLDIGIASVGWAVLQNDSSGEPFKIENLGVRVFDKAEQPKTGESLAAPRREARSARRRLRRHRHRLERIRQLLERSGIMNQSDILELYSKGGFDKSPYQLRAESMERALSKEEAVRCLIHLAQRRGYKSNSRAEEAQNEKEAGKIKTAIAENRLRMERGNYRTVGEMLWKDEACWGQNPDGTRYHQPRNKADDYRFTVERGAVVEEIKSIFASQRGFGVSWMSESLEKDYLTIFESQRNFDEGPGGDSPFGGGIGKKVGICTFEKDPPENRAPKAAYSYEYFRLLGDLSRMRIACNGDSPRALSAEERETLKAAAMQSASLSYTQLRKKLGLTDAEYFNELYYGGKPREEIEKRKWAQMQAYHKIRQALDKVEKNSIKELTAAQLDTIALILTIYKNDNNRLRELAAAGIPEKYYEVLLPLSFSKFGHLSLKALNKIIPLMENGLRYDEACTQLYGGHRGESNGERKQRLSIADMDEIQNPVVRRAVSQTIKVINAVVNKYGKPDVVRIELAREMGKDFNERRKIETQQKKNWDKNEKAREQIREYKGSSATGLDIVKFKLYEEQKGVCLYSGKTLDISRLFEAGYVDVDHIIPYSRCFDDSYQNKVLVLASENRQKGNRLPYEYFGQDAERWHSFEVRVENLIANLRKRQKLLKKALTEDESKEFIARNLNDTQYITRTIYNLVRNNLAFAESRYSKKPVQAVNGAVTAMLRGRWGVQKMREDGDLHHCLDAAVIAAVSPGLVLRVTEYSKRRENSLRMKNGYLDGSTGEIMTRKAYDEKYLPEFPPPWPLFHQELEARLHPDNPRMAIDRLNLATYESDEEIKPVFVSRMPNHKVTGAAHKETVRSRKKGDGFAVSKVPLSSLKLGKDGKIEGYYNWKSDMLLYNALVQRLEQFGGKGEKAFNEPFYKPKKDGTPGSRVDKVKIYEKTTLSLPVNDGQGLAANGDMLRIDVFYVEEDGYYFVPIYVADTKKKELPSKAVVANKNYEQWKEMKDEDFIFSLYAGDLLYIKSKKGIKLTHSKEKTGESEVVLKEGLYYYRGADISTAAISFSTHDRHYEARGIGIKTLVEIKKYQVDVLGNYSAVRLPEKRMGFNREN